MMKKLFTILFLLVSTTLFSQGGFPVNSTVGSPRSTVLTKGVSAADSGYQYRTNFQDTGSANNGELKNVPGVVIRVRSDLWMRDEYALSWIKIGSNASVIDTASLSNRINAKADSGLVWKNIGNYGTNPITNYIGTNDAHGFSIKVNGSRAGFIGHANMTSVFGGDVILGQFAGEAQDTLHKKNTIIGHAAMRYNTVANQSVAVGNWAGHHTIGSGDASGARFVYVGQSSGFYNLSGYSNTGIGTFTLERQFNGAGNSAWGRDALRTNNDGDYNTAGGILSMAYAASGVDSIIVTSGGSGYTSATITISSPFTGSTTVGTCWGVATATAVISGGEIVGITVNDPGCGYSISGGISGGGVTIPAGATVTITGDGAGASATAVIGAPRYTTSIGTTSGLYARMPLGGLYLGYNAGSNLRYRDKYVTLIGTNTSVSSSLSLYTNINKSIALGYGATISRSNILEIGANGADGVGVNLRYNKNYGSASLDSIGLLNVYDSLGNNMLYIKSWRPYSGSTIVAGYTSNIIFGDSAAYKNPYNWNSIVIGGQAMRNTPYNGNTVQTTVTGSFGLYSLQGGTGNTGIGEKVLYSLLGNATSPVPTSWNTAIGQRAAYYLVSGRDNFAGGQNSMSGIIYGDYNTATGSNSLGGSGVDTTSNASAYGIRALYGSGRRDNSSAFGYQAGFNTVGTGNLFLGYNAGASLGTVNNRLYIHNTSGTPLIYGEFDTYKLQINGDLTVTDTLTGVTLDNADSSDRMATTAWVKRQGYGGGGGGGTMVYPGAGIPLSTGSSWGTSIVNNSGNWNTAYGWGDHAGLYPTVSRFIDSLLNHTTRFNLVTGYLASKVDTGRTLTINGVTQSLGANRTWTLGTGNYGNIPVNRNGILTPPLSDSLDFDAGLSIKGQLSATNFFWAGNSLYPYLALGGNDPLVYFGGTGAAWPSIGRSGGILSLSGSNTQKRVNINSYLSGPNMVSFYDNGTSRSATFLKTTIYFDTIVGGASNGSLMGNAYIGDSTSLGTGNSGHMLRLIAGQGYNAASLNTVYSTVKMGNINSGATQGHGVSFQHDFIKTGSNTLDIMYGAAFLMDSVIAGTVNKRYGLRYWDAWVNGSARLGHQSALKFDKLKAAVGLNAHILADSSQYAQLDGNMLLGDSTNGSGARKAFLWFNGTAPTSSISGAIVWAEGGELKARDASGNVTTLTDAGGSGGEVDGGSFNTTTNTLTITQTVGSDVQIRIPPSYLLNPIHIDSLITERDDSTAIVKAVSVESDHPDISVTTIRNDSVNRHVISKVYVEEPIATFSAGAGFAIDTTMFTDSTIYGSFFTGQDSFYITRAVAVIKGQSGDTLGIQIIYNDTINLTGTVINGGTMAINSRTSGNIIDVSTNQGVPPGTWIWMKSPTVIAGKRPEYLSVTLIGYRKYQAP